MSRLTNATAKVVQLTAEILRRPKGAGIGINEDPDRQIHPESEIFAWDRFIP